jgi:hypothetical protein
MVVQSPQRSATVLTFPPLPTTEPLLSAFKASSLSVNSTILELSTTAPEILKEALSDDGMVVCCGSLASIAHLMAPRQKAFFDATEDSFLFRELVRPAYPDYKFLKTKTPWSEELTWPGRYVVKPNIGYSSVDTFVVHSLEELEALQAAVSSPPETEFVVEDYLAGKFICADLVLLEGGRVAVTSVYERHDSGIKETAQLHTAALYTEHAGRFKVRGGGGGRRGE